MASEVRGFTPRILLKYLQERTCFRWAAITSDSCSVASQQRVLLMKTSADQTAKVWDAQSGKELLTLRGRSDSVYGVAFSPDGKCLSTASRDATVQVYALDPRELLNLSRSRVAHTFTADECQRYSSPRPARPCPNFRAPDIVPRKSVRFLEFKGRLQPSSAFAGRFRETRCWSGSTPRRESPERASDVAN
jgi:WD40 repeat protein